LLTLSPFASFSSAVIIRCRRRHLPKDIRVSVAKRRSIVLPLAPAADANSANGLRSARIGFKHGDPFGSWIGQLGQLQWGLLRGVHRARGGSQQTKQL
jgi:hypothetical protein